MTNLSDLLDEKGMLNKVGVIEAIQGDPDAITIDDVSNESSGLTNEGRNIEIKKKKDTK